MNRLNSHPPIPASSLKKIIEIHYHAMTAAGNEGPPLLFGLEAQHVSDFLAGGMPRIIYTYVESAVQGSTCMYACCWM